MKLTTRQTKIIDAMREWPVICLYSPDAKTEIKGKFKIGNLFVNEFMLKQLENMGVIEMKYDNRIKRMRYVLRGEWK